VELDAAGEPVQYRRVARFRRGAQDHGPGAAASSAAATAGAEPADGRSCLRRASDRRHTERESRERALAQAHAVDRELRRYAVAATRHRPQSEQLTCR
jgi:hypothetical protein